ncbi:MAG TPA: alpha/beta fold hydrolase [Candidatus Limnocylindria bacterium]|nr:alpha/beta fold hydrolase [Candidatus Limnocylindria bacterium]
MTALVLIHAFPLSGAMWEHERRALRDAADPIIAPSLPGFGGTAVPRGDPSMDDYADSIVAAMDAEKIERAAIAGLSMGGYVAFAMWRRHRPRVERLFLADTRAEADTEEARNNRLRLAGLLREHGIEALLKTPPQWLRKGSPHWDPLLTMIRRQAPEAVAQGSIAMAHRPDSRRDLPTIDVPTAVVVGEQDAITPLEMSQAMSDAIPGATLSIIPGAGHLANIEAPTAFETALRAWLRRTA